MNETNWLLMLNETIYHFGIIYGEFFSETRSLLFTSMQKEIAICKWGGALSGLVSQQLSLG